MKKYLDWDSKFFGFKVVKFDFDNLYDLKRELNTSFSNGIKLIYAFSKEDIVDKKFLLEKNGLLIDNKVTYIKKNYRISQIQDDNCVVKYKDDKIEEDLYKLALKSGVYSRFKKDKRLPIGTFERLYKIWIEKSINGEMADVVFVYRQKKNLVGFITLKIKNKIGEIGLISVSEKYRGQKIATKLLKAVEQYLLENNIHNLSVVTQQDNKIACSFYESNGFNISSCSTIYHFINSK